METETAEKIKNNNKKRPEKLIGVSFRRCGKVYMFDPGELEIYPGDWVVVETIRGQELGQIMKDRIPVSETDDSLVIKPVIRKATSEDHNRYEDNKYLAAEAFRIGLEKIKQHGLPMKLVDVEYTLDQSKIVFYFSADGRVDFRALVRDLASVFHKRIELHQIGVRDVAKMLGGLGPCGLTCCCATHLHSFDPVSIKMAKEQGLSLNPVKISGTCGRLMCCLRYEHCQYQEITKDMPSIDALVTLPEGEAKVIDINIPKKTVIIKLPSHARVEYPSEAFAVIGDNSYKIKKGYAPFVRKKRSGPRP